jgi:hypothetical protein
MSQIILFVTSLFCLSVTACTTMTSSQSGRTAPKAQARAYAGLTSTVLPMLEADLRYGLTDRIELGGGLALPGNTHIRLYHGIVNGTWFSLGAR